jgi:metal-responsive CopG/Arc/MetJ family transcriptional regulator
MKVAVSIPDDVFAEADRLAARLKTSRSDVYARALDAFVADHAPDRVTEAIDRVVDIVGAESDDFAKAAARGTFDRVEW